MLWANDGSASDVLNFYTELFGDGKVMDVMRGHLAREAEQKPGLVQREIAETAARVKEHKERRVIEDAADLVQDFSVPLRLYHGYAAAFKMRAEEQGMVLEGNGYECWADDDFIDWFKRRHPELCYHEAPRNARIIVNETAPATTPKPLILAAA